MIWVAVALGLVIVFALVWVVMYAKAMYRVPFWPSGSIRDARRRKKGRTPVDGPGN